MCFINDDYDWTASVVEHQDITLADPVSCDECGRQMLAGERCHFIFMQEHEECRCEDVVCECESPDFGETSEYYRCTECDKFLRAVEAAEIQDGCPRSESRPRLGEMAEEIREAGDRNKYFKTALRMFPELKTSGYLGRLARDLIW